jgi:glycosyltransferase involved in cell wall biosynthesis
MTKISIVTPCFNEVGNIEELYERIQIAMHGFDYDYDHIFIDNASNDGTVDKIKELAVRDKRVKAIINARNFGHIRSPYYGFLHADGDAVVVMASDLQDPPERISEFIRKWEDGYKVVIGVKTKSRELGFIYFLRTLYYRILRSLTDVELIEHFTGFGLYDKKIIEILRRFDDPYPYFRGLIAEIGFPIARIEFTQSRRTRGISKNNFYTLYDMAMLGLISYTKIPLRLATMFGFLAASISLIVGLFYLVYKLIFWQEFTVGSAPIIVGLFFFGAIQLFFLGIVGEYIGAIYTQVLHRPLVIEKERINFDSEDQKKENLNN